MVCSLSIVTLFYFSSFSTDNYGLLLYSGCIQVETFGGEMHCCDEFQDVSLSHICFYFKNVSAAVKKKKFLFDFPLSRGVTLAPNLAESLGFKAARKRDIKVA